MFLGGLIQFKYVSVHISINRFFTGIIKFPVRTFIGIGKNIAKVL